MGATRVVTWGKDQLVEISADPVSLDIAAAHYELGGYLVGMRGGQPMALLRGTGAVHPNTGFMLGYDWHLVVTDSWSAQPPVQKGE